MNKISLGQIVIIILLIFLLFGDLSKLIKNITSFINKTVKPQISNKNIYKKKGN